MYNPKCDICGNELEIDEQGEYGVCFNCNKMFKLAGRKVNRAKEVHTQKDKYIKCDKCGGKVEIDKQGEYGVCFNCNTMFKLEKKYVKKKVNTIKLKPYQFILIAILVSVLVGINVGIKINADNVKNKQREKEYYEDLYKNEELPSDLKFTDTIFKSMLTSNSDIVIEYNGIIYTKDKISILNELIKNKTIRMDITYEDYIAKKITITEVKG